MKLKIYKIIFIVLLIALLIVGGIILFKYYNSLKNEQETKRIVQVFYEQISKKNNDESMENQQEITMNGYKVIGIVKIPKIDLEYPILDIETYNPYETYEPMKYSIVKYWGKNVNDYGNLSIAGHNKYDGTMFGKTKKLNIGDIVELTDLDNNTIKYKIYDKFVTDPNDVTILKTKDESIREVTLITCTNGRKERLILKAKEVINDI